MVAKKRQAPRKSDPKSESRQKAGVERRPPARPEPDKDLSLVFLRAMSAFLSTVDAVARRKRRRDG